MDAEVRAVVLQGDVPSPADPPGGCPFHPRCPYAEDRCSVEVPQLAEVAAGHEVACLRSEELTLRGRETTRPFGRE